jgi:hypothetical protein
MTITAETITARKGKLMNCPHCHQEIDAAHIVSERNRAIAAKPRPGARGLIRNPNGVTKQQPKKRAAKGKETK